MRIRCNSCEYRNCRTCNLDGHDINNDSAICPMMTKVPTPEEFKQEMQNIIQNENYEYEHNAADDYLCDVLRLMGYSEGIEIFEKLNKGYM